VRVNDNFAGGLLSATTNVSVSAATAPTAGQSLVASSSTAAAWGPATTLTSEEVSFTSTITTTSTTAVVMTGMTMTPVAGTYLVWFSTWMTNTTGNQTATISIYSGGVQKASSVMTIIPFSGAVGSVNDGVAVSTQGSVIVNGSQAIAIYWKTAAGTASAHNGTMNILRVA
jgi:hypothetical protein